MGVHRDWGVEATPEQLAWVAAHLDASDDWSGGREPGNRRAAPPRLIAAHRGAQARVEARDRRVRDEDLALEGRARLRADNTALVQSAERGGRW